MTARRVRPPGGFGAAAALAGVALVLSLGFAACDGPAVSPSAGATGPPATDPVPTDPGATGTAEPGPTMTPPTMTPPTQTDTAWGRIWDDVPPSFPLPPGASPTQTGSGAASAEFLVPAELEALLADLRPRFDGTNLRVTEVTSPLEDGSRTMELVGPGECRARIVLGPLDIGTSMTVWYGAACAWE